MQKQEAVAPTSVKEEVKVVEATPVGLPTEN
jgi:hypothetical protein